MELFKLVPIRVLRILMRNRFALYRLRKMLLHSFKINFLFYLHRFYLLLGQEECRPDCRNNNKQCYNGKDNVAYHKKKYILSLYINYSLYGLLCLSLSRMSLPNFSRLISSAL